MLKRLHIENIALIEKLELELQPGLNIFTGETGAGKSIIIDSVNLVLGERADKEMIRSCSERAVVEALFYVKSNKVLLALNDLNIQADDELILSRELSLSGKNVCKINGRLVNLATIKQISDLLVDIHGQHEHQSLFNPAVQRSYIDGFGGPEIAAVLHALEQQYEEWRSLNRQIICEKKSPEEIERRLDILLYQQKEITDAQLLPEEEAELLQTRAVLQNSERINAALNAGYDMLYSSEGAALPKVRAALSQIEMIESYADNYLQLGNTLREVFYSLEDICIALRNYKDTAEFDPLKREVIEDRLELINKLKRKYGGSIEDIQKFLSNIETEISEIEQTRAESKSAQKRIRDLEQTIYNISADLSQRRRAAARIFEAQLIEQLQDLGLEKTAFMVKFMDLPPLTQGMSFSADGLDTMEMMISTNPGEPLRPLSKVASGGEMSRIMLAFKAIAAQTDHISCMIFDEIDTGVSGKTASVVGEKMRAISKSHQVICVTHSPQITAMADAHYLIEKNLLNNKYITTSRLLGYEERISELARILGDGRTSETAIKHAKLLLNKNSSV